MNSTRTNGIADHSLDHDSETISSGRRGELPPDPDATLGKSHDREFIGNCGDHGSTKTQSTSTVNHSKRLDKSKSTRDEDEKLIIRPTRHIIGLFGNDFHRIGLYISNQQVSKH